MLIFRYLFKDALDRLRRAPIKSLTKPFLAGLLGGLGAVILLSFHVNLRGVLERLEKIGTHTVILREPQSESAFRQGENLLQHFFRDQPGESHFLQRIRLDVSSEIGTRPILLAYAPADIRPEYLSDSLETPLVYFDPKLERGLTVSFQIEGQRYTARSETFPPWLQKLTSSPVLLAPESFFQPWAQSSAKQFFALHDALTTEDAESLSAALRQLKDAQGHDDAWIHDATWLLEQQRSLNEQQTLWRWIIIGGFGAAITLILSSIAIFEYQETRYVAALLKSFGVRSRWILLQLASENVVLLNFGLLCSITILGYTWHPICVSLGFEADVLAAVDYRSFLQSEGGWLFAFINGGVLLGSIPFALGAREEIGRVLE